MNAIVSKIEENSIAEELEIQPGDEIISIDNQQMKDLIDYNFLCKNEFITAEIKKNNGEIEILEIEKEYEEDLGIIFEKAVFDKIKSCYNKCIFCFVDQQPKGLRDTLYIKDDDYRLSYLQGTYITLTNLTQEDKERIEKLKIGPFYISVHTTNPELRIKMLKNPNAGKIFEDLKWLERLEIPVHLQIVLCPEYNDGDELKKTLNDFKKLKNILSVAIVPVGLTKFRSQKPDEKLYPVTKKIAKSTIEIVKKFNMNSKRKKNIICCSDEFFALADEAIPPKEYYGNFAQLEDGVGTLRLLLEDFNNQKKRLPKVLKNPCHIIFATSLLAKPAIKEISNELNKIKNCNSQALAITSNYWGDGISVAGLITSDDLINELIKYNQSKIPCNINPIVLLPSVILKPFSEDFLDGKNLDYVKEKTGLDFLIIKNCYSTKEIVDFVS
jgi:putative radical SAM enzyme (TIGR03279 family)